MRKFPVHALIFLGLVVLSQEAYVSGMSAGGVGTGWYNLTIFGGVYVSPEIGSEDSVYGGLREEGNEFDTSLEPYRKKFEKIVIEAKQKFSAPIVLHDPNRDNGYIDGVIIEDVPEFDPVTIPSNIDPQERRDRVSYENELFQRILAEEPSKKKHFLNYFKEGSQIYVEFTAHLPDSDRYYQFGVTVEQRIKRSTLNWIRSQVTPDVINALENQKKSDHV